ncbi:hypothetical protein Trydic_g2189 [Trypoxylus dichotomus]
METCPRKCDEDYEEKEITTNRPIASSIGYKSDVDVHTLTYFMFFSLSTKPGENKLNDSIGEADETKNTK